MYLKHVGKDIMLFGCPVCMYVFCTKEDGKRAKACDQRDSIFTQSNSSCKEGIRYILSYNIRLS